MYNTQEIAKRIKNVIKTRNEPLGTMLSNLEMGVNTVSELGKGKQISYLNFAKIADYLDVSVDYLLGRESSKNLLDALSLSDEDKFIVQAYINLPPEDRTALVEIIKKIVAGADVQITTDTEKMKIQQEAPQRPDIEISQIPERAIARSKDNPFIEVPTLEQIASFTPVPEDSDL